MNLFDRLDFICFRRQWHGVVGQFAVFADGIQIIRSFPKKEMWRRSFSELVEMRKITSPNLEKEKCLELKFADGSVGQVETMKRRLVLPLASLNSSGSNFSLSLGKVFSGEQVGLESVGRRHSGLLEKDTKGWPERTRQMQQKSANRRDRIVT